MVTSVVIKPAKYRMSFQSSSLCNLTLEEKDLKKLEDLDPFQIDGFESFGKVSLPVNIHFEDEIGRETSDRQVMELQMVCKWGRTTTKPRDAPALQIMKLIVTSEEDLFLNFISNCTKPVFDAMCLKNQLNFNFGDFPATVRGILQNCRDGESRDSSQAYLRINFQGIAHFQINKQTEYKKINLLDLTFNSSSLEKTHQSIIYRFNYNKAKLTMIENSIDSIYGVLAAKNPPLLHYIEKTVGAE